MMQIFKSVRPVYQATLLIAVLSVAATAATMMLTPGLGAVGTVMARASFVHSTDIKIKVKDGEEEVLHMPNAQETVVQQIKIAPGGHTGWHSHPGPVIVLIKSGELTFYDSEFPGCPPTHTFVPGESFVGEGQGHVHIAKNTGSTELELWAVYLDVPPGGAFRNDLPLADVPAGCPVNP
jgi:quercetin dioxygenase-like cupin family protein